MISNKNQTDSIQVDLVQSNILSALSGGELSFDDLAEKTKLPSSQLQSELIKIEMFGLIKKGEGNIYYKLQ